MPSLTSSVFHVEHPGKFTSPGKSARRAHQGRLRRRFDRPPGRKLPGPGAALRPRRRARPFRRLAANALRASSSCVACRRFSAILSSRGSSSRARNSIRPIRSASPSLVTEETRVEPRGCLLATRQVGLAVHEDCSRMSQRTIYFTEPNENVGSANEPLRPPMPMASTSSANSRSPAVSVRRIGTPPSAIGTSI